MPLKIKVTRENYFDVAQGVYWFAVNWHAGQWSELYRLQCTLGYQPGACENGPEHDTEAMTVYRSLSSQACHDGHYNSAVERAVSLAEEVKRVYDEVHK